MSLTLTVSGTESILQNTFFPNINLEGDRWEVALLNFETFHSIPNLVSAKFLQGRLGASDAREYEIPTGSYEIDDIEQIINSSIGEGNLQLKGNRNTLRTELITKRQLFFNKELSNLLGFDEKEFTPGKKYTSEHPANIFKVNIIRVICNITSGSYLNGKPTNSVHEFFPAVPPGYKIIEVPNTLIYHPVKVSELSNLTLEIYDQDNKLIDFRGEKITCRLHLRRAL